VTVGEITGDWVDICRLFTQLALLYTCRISRNTNNEIVVVARSARKDCLSRIRVHTMIDETGFCQAKV
jgi:hypothetical protein